MRGVQYEYGKVSEIDMSAREVVTQYDRIPFDRLVIAAGTTNNFFGMEGLDEHVYTLKTVPEAIRTRNAILGRLERAGIEKDAAKRQALLTFVVVGGGPAGVEVAGALGEMKRYIVEKEYPRISREDVRVLLVEGTGKVLGSMSEASSADAEESVGRTYGGSPSEHYREECVGWCGDFFRWKHSQCRNRGVDRGCGRGAVQTYRN